MGKKEPKYSQLRKTIIERIERGDFKEDEMIPSERELMDVYQVSRITVRRAIEEMCNAGVLYKVHGKGTFVKGERHTQNLFSIISCTEDIKSMGMVPSRVVVKKHIEQVSTKVRNKLNLNTNDEIFNLARVYYADATPVNYTDTQLPYKYFKDLEMHDFSKQSLYSVLENEYDIEITKAVRSIEAVSANRTIGKYLHIKEGTPLILFSATTYGLYNGKEIPLEYFISYYHTEQFKFYIHQKR
jgi:GntR family transcriptional regulator